MLSTFLLQKGRRFHCIVKEDIMKKCTVIYINNEITNPQPGRSKSQKTGNGRVWEGKRG